MIVGKRSQRARADCLRLVNLPMFMFLVGTKTIATSVAICYRQHIPTKGDNLPWRKDRPWFSF
jgi:hypothetical protein